ncbi:unnamed protein product [Cuscuta epithymum]|uniref:SUPPRESSOR OF ABI3-5 n=1 Tax=Cuscuta epithymum TaxID=186058 RepID=A0AAV0CTV9_9ASTE|nr:unnamed protein product [Cuscuta epithymum]
MDERFSRDDVYSRSGFHHDGLDREQYPHPPPAFEMWPQARRRSYEEEYPMDRDLRRNEKLPARYGGRDRDDYANDHYDYRHRVSHQSREHSRERDYDYGRHGYDSDYDRGSRRDSNWRQRGSRDREHDRRDSSRERDYNPYSRHEHSRSRSRDCGDCLRSRSPRSRSHSRSLGEDSYDEFRYDRGERRRDSDDRRHHDSYYSLSPSATVVVKGLSHKTTEEDLYQILAEWGPLCHVRVIKERSSGNSRGFAFIDFPSVGAAQAMMDKLWDDGLLVDGRRLFFEYSSKPTGGSNGPLGIDSVRSSQGSHRRMTVASDWMCTVCGCVNFARRTSCFQCNEPRADDAPPADKTMSNPTSLAKRGEAGPTHVLVVRGLDEDADEEMLRYEFSKHSPIKDLRLVRDKFTHVSRGFAFVHFYSVEDASKALEATNGTTLERNGQILRVAYAKSILGPGSGASQASTLAAAAIEAATFAQQYDAIGWAPKEYNPDEKQSNVVREQAGEVAHQEDGSAAQSGFVWDEASGYYFDAASGFYYDGNTGLYYDGNNGIWYSYDQQTQIYIPCDDQNDKASRNQEENASNARKVIISAPATMTLSSDDKTPSLPDAIQAAATAAMAAEKKEKEKSSKEIKIAKSSILANKKKMSNVLTMWKQRTHESQAPRVALDDTQTVDEERSNSATKAISSSELVVPTVQSVGMGVVVPVKGVIRSSGTGVVKNDTTLYTGSLGISSTPLTNTEVSTIATSYRMDPSALSSHTSAVTAASGGKRRFSEIPSQHISDKEQMNNLQIIVVPIEIVLLSGGVYMVHHHLETIYLILGIQIGIPHQEGVSLTQHLSHRELGVVVFLEMQILRAMRAMRL